MKFKSSISHLKVWNPTTRRELCQFKNGVYETEDPLAIMILDAVSEVSRSDGSEPDGEAYVAPPEPEKIDLDNTPLVNMSFKQLKEYAKKNKVVVPNNTRSKVKLIAVIEDELGTQEDEE